MPSESVLVGKTFTHDELMKIDSMGGDLGRDLGPYSMIGGSGIPEGGNFSASIRFGDGSVLEMESWGYTHPGVLPLSPEELDELYNRLTQAQGMAVLRERGYPEGVAQELMGRFWSLEGVSMENGVPVEDPPDDEE